MRGTFRLPARGRGEGHRLEGEPSAKRGAGEQVLGTGSSLAEETLCQDGAMGKGQEREGVASGTQGGQGLRWAAVRPRTPARPSALLRESSVGTVVGV